MFPPDAVLAEATLADVPILLDLMRLYYEYDGHPFVEETAQLGLERLLRDPSLGVAWVIYDAEEPAGYLVACFGYALEYAGRDAFIDEFYVKPEYRESGIGSNALSQVEEQLTAMGLKAMYLLVMPGNDRAEQFYRRAGYDDTGRLLLSKGLGEDE